MRLIDADVLIAEICQDQCERKYCDCDYTCSVVAHVVNAPTVEAVPVVHGKWIVKDSGLWQDCSVCGVAVEVDSMYMCKASEDMNFNYCPHCGAKMEGLYERSD